MPIVDVTDLLVDPDVAGQSFVVIRRQETVNNYGESTWSQNNIPAIGSIQPSGDNSLMREDNNDASISTIKVMTTTRLRSVAAGPNGSRFKPDIILWNGNYYEVYSINSWTPFGAGFVEAEASTITYVDLPAPALLPYVARLDFSNPANSGLAHGAAAGMG